MPCGLAAGYDRPDEELEGDALQTVLHLTDTHLFADKTGELRGTVTYDALEGVLEHLREDDFRPEHIALTGDLVQDESPDAYDHFPQLFGDPGPSVLCVPGNHDSPEVMQQKLDRAPFAYCASLRAGPWQLVGLDSTVAGAPGGRISDTELDRLRQLVETQRAQHVAVFLHHPPIDVGSSWLDSVGLDNGEEFLEVLDELGTVRLVGFGHVHQAVDEERRNIAILGTPSTCRQFKPGSDDFALDDRPPAYRRIRLNDDGRVESELVWID